MLFSHAHCTVFSCSLYCFLMLTVLCSHPHCLLFQAVLICAEDQEAFTSKLSKDLNALGIVTVFGQTLKPAWASDAAVLVPVLSESFLFCPSCGSAVLSSCLANMALVSTTHSRMSDKHCHSHTSSLFFLILLLPSLTRSSLDTHNHRLTHTIACTCCYDGIKGIQDLKIYSHADSLTLSM